MKRAFKMIVAAIFVMSSVAYAEARWIPTQVKVEKSDLIALVEVLSITEIEPRWVEDEHGNFKPNPNYKEGGEQRSAQVKVIQSVKGLRTGEIYTLEFGSNAICPSVGYEKGDKCLVFNTQMSNGHYSTFNTQYGKYMVEENMVARWNSRAGQSTPLNNVVDEITKIMKAPKKTP